MYRVAAGHYIRRPVGCQSETAVAAEGASFATPGVKIGLFCTTPMVPLVRAIPAKPALEMLLTGKPISAKRALELGLVNRVVPVGDGLEVMLDRRLRGTGGDEAAKCRKQS